MRRLMRRLKKVGLMRGLLLLSLCGVGLSACDRFNGNTEVTDLEWERISSLSVWNDSDPAVLHGIGRPPPDPSNAMVPADGYPVDDAGELSPAAALGKAFFFDPRFSGKATASDWLGRVRPEHAHVPAGTPIHLACVSCHDLNRAASDPLASPISLGAGSIGANAPPLVNVPFFPLLHDNGRVDSLWSQAMLVTEAGIVLNDSRLEVAWTIWRAYRDRYQAQFHEGPFGAGVDDSILRDLQGRVVSAGTEVTTGQCQLTAGTCEGGCGPIAGVPGCWPRFPLAGSPVARAATDVCADGTSGAACCVDPRKTPYNCMAQADRAAVDQTFLRFAKLIATFEQTLVRANAPFDKFVHEGRGSKTLSAEARHGAQLFVTKAGCYECHNTPLFSNRKFVNIGVATTEPLNLTKADCPAGNAACDCVTGGTTSLTSCLPWGALTGLELLRRSSSRRDSASSDDPLDTTVTSFLATAWPGSDAGPPDETGIPSPLPDVLEWGWKIPGLRDVALTAPYMHNGRYQTLEEVIEHYDRGGDSQAPGETVSQIKPLALTDEEKRALVAFLKSLTGAPWPAAIAGAPTLPPEVP